MEHSDEKKQRILVVDDNEIILVAMRETLADEPVEVVTCRCPKEAVGLLNDEHFAVVISDNRMPQMDGLEFLSHAKDLQPYAVRVLMTGVMQLDTVINAINQGEVYRFVSKPWVRDELLKVIHSALKKHADNVARRVTDVSSESRFLKDLSKRGLDCVSGVAEESSVEEVLSEGVPGPLQFAYRVLAAYEPLLAEQTSALVEICKRMVSTGHFSDAENEVLMSAAWLHSIGLVQVSRETIFNFHRQPEELSETERYQIDAHPRLGALLARFAGVSPEVEAVVRAQRERWDGTGVPEALQQENIPKLARYLAVAIYYIERRSQGEDPIEAIVAESGKGFFPEAVRLFLKVSEAAKLPDDVRELLFDELQEGMVLRRDVHTPHGLLLFPKGQVISAHDLAKLEEYNAMDPLTDRILVEV